MKIEKIKVTSHQNSPVSIISREEFFFQAAFHSYPELELASLISTKD